MDSSRASLDLDECFLMDNSAVTERPALSAAQISNLDTLQHEFTLFDSTIDSSSSDDMFSPPQTVSPQELLLDQSKRPSSAALTNMSTPAMDYDHSPFAFDSTLQTPASGGSVFLDETLDTHGMYSLFPTESPEIQHINMVESFDSPMSRTVSSTDEALTTSHAAVNGVKSRSRSKPLPAIESRVEDDAATAKRKRNTLAARKSREKKQSVLSSLELERDDLQALVSQWKHKAEQSERRVQQLELRLHQLSG